MCEPVLQRRGPAAIACELAAAQHLRPQLGRVSGRAVEAFLPRPLQQAVQEAAGPGTSWEVVQQADTALAPSGGTRALGALIRRAIGTFALALTPTRPVALTVALGTPADIYLIDEGMPSTTDAEFNRKAGSILRQKLQDATVIVVSHQASTLEKFCRSAAVLRNGHLHIFDTLEEAKRLYNYETQG